MGVPDFLKFVARTSPSALCRIPKKSNATPLSFDFVLVDTTNAHQTIGFEALSDFLKHLNVCQSIIFAMDARRHRAGTTRGHRTHATAVDTDVAVQQMCVELQRHYAQRGSGSPEPRILISGRQVAGEADYKILDIHRQLLTQVLALGSETLPSFLFVSEDSDLLCGALCGPAPQTVSIATKLRDVMSEICILRFSHVLAYVAVCVDALGGEDSKEKENHVDEQVPDISKDSSAVAVKSAPQVDSANDLVFRRKKQDGPMVATGTRVTLSDSDSESDNDHPVYGNNKKVDKGEMKTSTKELFNSVAVKTPVTAHDISVAEVLHNSCVDWVFLFVIVMGNGGNVPPLVHGATRVDIQSCWKMYCRMKYDTADPGREKVMGRCLLCLNDPMERSKQQSHSIASITIDCSFLRSIVEAAHYADAQSRPPVEEEKERAVLFLTQAVYTTLRYILACNVFPDVAAWNTFLDSRPLMESEVTVPSLSAFLWVLGQVRRRKLYFPLVGLATETVLANAANGPSAVETAMNSAISRSSGAAAHNNVELYADVGGTLVASGTEGKVVQLHKFYSPNDGKPRANRQSIVARIEECVAKAASTSNAPHMEKDALFSKIVFVWQRTLASYVPALRSIVQTEQFVSPLTGLIVSGEDLLTGDTAATHKGKHSKMTTQGAKLSYSFELRRMAPVLMKETEKESKSDTSSTANTALLHALRVSYDYAEQQPVPTNVITEDYRIGKKKQMENKESAKKRHRETRESETKVTDEELDKKKYRRLGKKEREKLNKKLKREQSSLPSHKESSKNY